MAVEVQSDEYLFQPRTNFREPTSASSSQPSTAIALLPFLHNYLHDIEGLWWIGLWFLFNTYPSSRVAAIMRSSQHSEHRHFADALFPDSIGGSNPRTHFRTNPQYHKRHLGTIPEEYSAAMSEMSGVLQVLTDATEHVEKSSARLFNKASFAQIYDELSPLFATAARVAYNQQVILASNDFSQIVDKVEQDTAAAAEEQSHETRPVPLPRTTRSTKRTREVENENPHPDSKASKKQKTRSATPPPHSATPLRRSTREKKPTRATSSGGFGKSVGRSAPKRR